MAKETNLNSIKQGDADTLTEVVSELSSLSGYTAKMYIKKPDGTAIDTITGTIDTLTITYEIYNNDSILYPIGVNKYETKIVDTSDHVYTLSYGTYPVEAALNKNPHTT